MERSQTSEARLQALLGTSDRATRFRWAREIKSRGGRVIGVISPYVPEEIIHAAGMFSVRLWGSAGRPVEVAAHRPTFTNSYHSAVLEAALNGELDFLDGVVASDADDSLKRMGDVWVAMKRPAFAHILHVPSIETEAGRERFTGNLTAFVASLEQFGEARITADALRCAVELHDQMRCLLRGVYELRKRPEPPLLGAEFLALTLAATAMPKDVFIGELEALLPYLAERKPRREVLRPRVLVSSDDLDDPAFLRVIEAAGALVAMDDLDTGSRYCWSPVGAGDGDDIAALAAYYLTRPQGPHMLDWHKQLRRLIAWCREFQIDGVIELPILYDYPREWRLPFLNAQLSEAGIPCLSVKRDYLLAQEGQLATRVGAFLEMLDSGH